MSTPKGWPQPEQTSPHDHPQAQAEETAASAMSARCWRYVEDHGGLQTWVEGAPSEDGFYCYEKTVIVGKDPFIGAAFFRKASGPWPNVVRHMKINTGSQGDE